MGTSLSRRPCPARLRGAMITLAVPEMVSGGWVGNNSEKGWRYDESGRQKAVD